MTVRGFSYGGGVQSTAALVLAAEGRIDFRHFYFANVGEDSENPSTLDYVREIAMPYADAHGVEIVELRKRLRDGSPQTLVERIEASARSIPIPVRMGKDGAPGNRSCTAEFKIRVIEKELRRRGATKDDRAIVGLGISLDEWHRAGTPEDPRSPYQLREYPLIDQRIDRAQCSEIIRAAGLPVPDKSACFFCPFHTSEQWRLLAQRSPDLFEKACQLEEKMTKRGEALGGGEFYFTRYGRPLRELFDGNQTALFDESQDGCESGYCMT